MLLETADQYVMLIKKAAIELRLLSVAPTASNLGATTA